MIADLIAGAATLAPQCPRCGEFAALLARYAVEEIDLELQRDPTDPAGLFETFADAYKDPRADRQDPRLVLLRLSKRGNLTALGEPVAARIRASRYGNSYLVVASEYLRLHLPTESTDSDLRTVALKIVGLTVVALVALTSATARADSEPHSANHSRPFRPFRLSMLAGGVLSLGLGLVAALLAANVIDATFRPKQAPGEDSAHEVSSKDVPLRRANLSGRTDRLPLVPSTFVWSTAFEEVTSDTFTIPEYGAFNMSVLANGIRLHTDWGGIVGVVKKATSDSSGQYLELYGPGSTNSVVTLVIPARLDRQREATVKFDARCLSDAPATIWTTRLECLGGSWPIPPAQKVTISSDRWSGYMFSMTRCERELEGKPTTIGIRLDVLRPGRRLAIDNIRVEYEP